MIEHQPLEDDDSLINYSRGRVCQTLADLYCMLAHQGEPEERIAAILTAGASSALCLHGHATGMTKDNLHQGINMSWEAMQPPPPPSNDEPQQQELETDDAPTE